MKSVFQFICTALFVTMSVSCSKDEMNMNDSLEGTKWQMIWNDTKGIIVKSKYSTNNFKKIRILQFSETRFGSFVGLFLCFDVYKQ